MILYLQEFILNIQALYICTEKPNYVYLYISNFELNKDKSFVYLFVKQYKELRNVT
jgi:hypothetical protein